MRQIKLKKSVQIFFCCLIVHLFTHTVSAAWPNATDQNKTNASSQVALEVGIDSSARLFYQPKFVFDLTLASLRFYIGINYLQRSGDDIQQAIDFWVKAGVIKEWGKTLSATLSFNHLCRHHALAENVDVLNLNELIGQFRIQTAKYIFGVGFGVFTYSPPGYSDLMILNMELPHIWNSLISLRSEFKFVNFKTMIYEAEMAFTVARNTDIFIRQTRDYEFPSTSYMGVRYHSDGPFDQYVDAYHAYSVFHISDNQYKMAVGGEMRLKLFNSAARQLLLSIEFFAPLLYGNTFFSTFYPDKIVYNIMLQYEYQLRDALYLALYSLYHADIPIDKKVGFGSDWGVGLQIRNQHDFERLAGRPVRIEIAGGYNTAHDYDFNLKLGFHARSLPFLAIAGNAIFNLNSMYSQWSGELFLQHGDALALRILLRVERQMWSTPVPFSQNRYMFGIQFLKWVDTAKNTQAG